MNKTRSLRCFINTISIFNSLISLTDDTFHCWTPVAPGANQRRVCLRLSSLNERDVTRGSADSSGLVKFNTDESNFSTLFVNVIKVFLVWTFPSFELYFLLFAVFAGHKYSIPDLFLFFFFSPFWPSGRCCLDLDLLLIIFVTSLTSSASTSCSSWKSLRESSWKYTYAPAFLIALCGTRLLKRSEISCKTKQNKKLKRQTEKQSISQISVLRVMWSHCMCCLGRRRRPQCEVSVCSAALRHAGLSESSGRQTDNRLRSTLVWLARRGGRDAHRQQRG